MKYLKGKPIIPMKKELFNDYIYNELENRKNEIVDIQCFICENVE